MREIKFRVFDKESGVMYPDATLYPDFSLDDFVLQTRPNELKREYLTDRFVLEQYTGLKDENDIEIYEGDIVETVIEPDIDGYRGEEVYSVGGAFYPVCTQPGEMWRVIGNIHEEKP